VVITGQPWAIEGILGEYPEPGIDYRRHFTESTPKGSGSPSEGLPELSKQYSKQDPNPNPEPKQHPNPDLRGVQGGHEVR